MKPGTEDTSPKLPCPQCREPMPIDIKQCRACGSDLHVDCPDCGTRRGAEDVFCRNCGYKFDRRKLRLKEQTPSAGPAEENQLPRVGFYKPGKRYQYRMSPLKGAIRAFLMFLLLFLIAAGLFLAFNQDWGKVVCGIIMEQVRGASAAWKAHTKEAEKAAAPDWKARYQYWYGYYRDVFSLPPTNSQVEVALIGGVREQGIFLQVTNGCVFLNREGKERSYMRLELDDATLQVFYFDEFASVNAKKKVKAEQAEWKRQAAAQSAAAAVSAAATTAPPTPAGQSGGATSAAPEAVRTFLEIKCPVCSGMGYLVEGGSGARPGAGGISSGGSPFSGGVALKQSAAPKAAFTPAGKRQCPVCLGKGLRRFDRPPDFPWPAGASRCAKCQGMGVTWTRSEQGLQVSTCPICDHRGFVVNKYDASQNVPPKYE